MTALQHSPHDEGLGWWLGYLGQAAESARRYGDTNVGIPTVQLEGLVHLLAQMAAAGQLAEGDL